MHSISMSKRWLIVNLVKCYHNIHLISNIQSVSSWSWHLGGLSFPQCFSSPLSLSSSFLFSNPPFDFHFLLLSTFSIIHFPILSLIFMCTYSQISDTSNSTNLLEFFDSSDILISESCFGFSVNLHLTQVGTTPHPDSSQEIFTQGDFNSVLFTLYWRLSMIWSSPWDFLDLKLILSSILCLHFDLVWKWWGCLSSSAA